MSEKLLSVLAGAGLSKNQAAVYLAALSHGPSRATELSKFANIKRTTTYPVLQSLQELGLVSTQTKGFKTSYQAESPEKLEALVDEKHRRLKASLAELSTLRNLKRSESEIKYFAGKASIKTVYDGLLEDTNEGEDYLIISSPQTWHELDPKFFNDFIARRAKLKIKIRSLLLDSDVARDYIKNQKTYNLKAKLLPKEMNFTANIVVIPKKVVIHQLVEPIWAMVIEDRNIAKTFSELFEGLWQKIT